MTTDLATLPLPHLRAQHRLYQRWLVDLAETISLREARYGVGCRPDLRQRFALYLRHTENLAGLIAYAEARATAE